MFSAQDNGPGIDPAFHGRIFGVFQRLHGKDYPGDGPGRAFCKKAIEGTAVDCGAAANPYFRKCRKCNSCTFRGKSCTCWKSHRPDPRSAKESFTLLPREGPDWQRRKYGRYLLWSQIC